MSETGRRIDEANRLSQIATLWSVVRRAHGSQTTTARQAKQQLLERYGVAIRRYLLGALRNETDADDVYQNFAVDFLEGKLASADQDRGRFRAFLKTVLYRQVADYHRRRGRDRLAPNADIDSAQRDDPVRQDEEFDRSWRNVLLGRAWDALHAIEVETDRPLFTVLRLRVEMPDASSTELARKLSTHLGRTLTSTHLRVWLHRARDKFADLLLGETRQSLDDANRDAIEQELSDLELLEYCRPALKKYAED